MTRSKTTTLSQTPVRRRRRRHGQRKHHRLDSSSNRKALPQPANISSTQMLMPAMKILEIASLPPNSVRSLYTTASPSASGFSLPPTASPSASGYYYGEAPASPFLYELSPVDSSPSSLPPMLSPSSLPPTSPISSLPPMASPPLNIMGTPPTVAPSPSVPSRRPSSRPTSERSPESTVSVPLVVGLTFGAVSLVLIVLFLFLFWRKWKRERVQSSKTNMPDNYILPQTQQRDGNQNCKIPGNLHQEYNPPTGNQNVTIHDIDIPPQASLPTQDANSSRSPQDPDHINPSTNHSKNTFSYQDLAKATNGFSKENFPGKGGFGLVYKGVLPDGIEVAVKQLSSDSWQGEREFRAEVEIISRVHHRHLVSLVGYCVTQQTMMLVYEFVPNGTLDFHLHDEGEATLDWSTRVKVALGSAKGLAYLHEDCRPKIIHRDIKTANILLDRNYEAQVTDFGLAKFFTDTRTHITTRVVGTFGYLAPEYAASGKVTEKSDVFSFGIVLLEMITGRKPIDKTLLFENDNMVDWAMPLLVQALAENDYETIVDKRLKGNYSKDEMKRMVACAAACIRHSVRHRPKMSQVARILEGDVSIEDLNQGVRPGHTRPYYGSSGASSHNDSSGNYNERKKNPRTAKGELTSSEYSESTGEYNHE